MERKIGEIFEYNGEKIQVVSGHRCFDCYFTTICLYMDKDKELGECGGIYGTTKSNVIFKLVDMCKNKEEKRNVELTLEKAKEWYKKGGELKEVALQAFSEKELKLGNRSHSWEEFCENNPIKLNERCISECCFIVPPFNTKERDLDIDQNYYPSEEYAKAALALCQLLQLRQEWIGDWKPNWKNENSDKYIIYVYNDFISIRECTLTFGSISFPSEKMANEFLNDFRELLEIAKPLL